MSLQNRCCSIVILLTSLLSAISTTNLAPSFTLDINNLVLSERTPVGEVVFTLEGTDPENSPVHFGLHGTDLLRVDRDSGDVTVVKALDREVNDTLNFFVTIEDEVADAPLGGNNVVEVPVTVIILDENDNAPFFIDAPYEVHVEEDTTVGTTIFRGIALHDPDSVGETLEVSCIDLPEFPSACDSFAVEALDATESSFGGVLTLEKPLNYAEMDEYQLTLKATDGTLTSNTTLRVYVGDVQNTPPTFKGDLKAAILENAPINTLIMTVHAIDGDRQRPRKIFYELVNNPMGYFLLDAVTGELRTARPLDREAIENPTGTLLLTIKARELVDGTKGDDPLTVSTAEASITVEDVNDEPPIFNKRDYYVEIPENIAEGSAFPNLNMTVRDPDLGSNSVFSLELDDISGAFSIDPQIAEGTTDVSIRISNSSLDYENPNQRKFIILVIAKEVHTDLLLSSTATVTVTVADANDNAPLFDQDSYSATISEMASPGSLVATIVAKDRDSGKFGDNGLVYQLSGSGAEKFRVNNRTGTITVTECTLPGSEDCLDYETKAEYLLMFRATDDDGKGQTTNVPLKITLTDSNDNAPMFGLPIYRVFIDEGAVRFDPDLIVTARDADKTSHVTYTIIAGNMDDLFYIDPNTGRIRITSNKGLDMSNDTETNDNLVLTVEANDGKYTATTLLNIIVRDVNNNAPIFEKENYILSIAEDTKVGTSVLQVVATDADVGENAEIEYHLQKGALDDFDVNAKSGVISIVSKLDFDRRNTYNVEVVATDKGDPSLSTTVPLTVTVINTNDKLPYFVPATQKAEVLEDAPIGTVVHTLITLDPDVNSSEALNFAATEPITALDKHGRQVLTGTDEFKEFFAVNKNTGKVTVLNPIRRDLAAIVRISVLVTDITAATIQQGQGMLIITITDVNDSPPSFVPPWTPQNPIYKLELKEEQPVGTIVATYSAYDEDSDIAGYAINPTSEYFEINNGTGIIQIKKIIDYEVTQHLNFTIYAYDSGFPQLNASAKVEVDVINVNDNNPVFDEQEYNVTIDENLPEGAHIIQVHATDKDLGDFGVISYSLVGEHKEHFAINPRTGQITVSDSDFLDREVLSDVTVQVLASDSGDSGSSALKRTHSVPVHIIISDVNDNAPKFNQSVYSVRVVENVRMNPPVPIAQVLAIDKDVGEYGTVRYRIIAGNDDGVFLLSEDNGILYPHKSLMGQTHMFRLLVEARDGDGPHAFTDRATIHVQVENINEHKPKFLMPALSNATVEITENAATVDFLVMTVKATDKDIGENGRVTYHLKLNDSIVQSTDEFIIDPDTGELRTRKYLDRHMQSRYELILVARDHGIPTWYETIQHLSVLLVDTSDNKPEFPDTKTASPYIFHITENGSKDVRIGQVKVLNKPYHITPGNPATAPVYYYIIGGNEDRSFYLDKLDGSIYTNRSFDREKRTAYELYVLANNDPEFYLTGAATEGTGSAEMQSIMREYDGSVAKVRVEVEDVNDNPPKFPYEIYHAAVNAMASVNEFILNVTAVDPDRGLNGSLSYYIKASNLYKYGSAVSSGSIIPSPFNITQDGQLNTATYLAENNQHRFMVDVVAKENAWPERQSIAKVHIWVFEPNQLNRIILSRPVEEVLRERDEIIAELSNATQSLVIVDEIRYHTDDLGRKNDDWSDMYILVVDPRTYTIVPVTEVLKTIDAQYDFLKDYYAGFAIENVVPAFITEKEEAFDPALAALIALLIVLCVGVITFIVVCCCLRHWAMAPSSSLKKKDALIKKAIIDDLNTTENPLWIEQKLKIYEEQELTMQVFNEPEQTALARRDSEEFIPDENTYATIQHPTRRGSQHMATLSLNDEIADYATLSRVPNSCYEAAMGFQGSTFQVPESASNSADFESYNISRYKNGSNGSLEGPKNRQTNYVTELL